jgi:uncharacterized membrane protein YkvI
MWRAGFKWIFLVIGATVGAGYASGRELWQFFGHESGLAIVLFALFFSICIAVILHVSYKQQSSQYRPVLQAIVGKRLTKFYDVMIFFYLYSVTAVMIAGSGATVQAFNFPYWVGIVIIVIALIVIFWKGINQLIALNQLMMPLLIIGLLLILILFIKDQDLKIFSNWVEQSNWMAAFPFTALNVLPLIAVLGAIGNQIKSKQEIVIASVGSGLVLGIVSFIYNSSLIQISDQILVYEIPLFAILSNYSVEILLVMSFLLWIAIYTTAATNILGIITRIRGMTRLSTGVLAALTVFSMLPITIIGFSALVQYIYPIYAILNLYVLTRLLLFPIWFKVEGRR